MLFRSMGWYRIAFVHLAGHACFRLLQFLSAPNVLHDLHGMEEAIGEHVTPARSHPQLFLFALERGFLDSILDRVVIDPFTRVARSLTRLDQALCDMVLSANPAVGVDSLPRRGREATKAADGSEESGAEASDE